MPIYATHSLLIGKVCSYIQAPREFYISCLFETVSYTQQGVKNDVILNIDSTTYYLRKQAPLYLTLRYFIYKRVIIREPTTKVMAVKALYGLGLYTWIIFPSLL